MIAFIASEFDEMRLLLKEGGMNVCSSVAQPKFAGGVCGMVPKVK